MIPRFAKAAGAALFIVLAGCSTTSTPTAVQTAAADVGDIASGLAAIVPQLGSVTGLSAANQQTIETAVDDLQSAATALQSASSITAAQPLVERVEADVNAVVDALAGMSLPGTIGEVVDAAAVLLPVIETAVNLVAASTTPTASDVTMTPGQAILILKGAAGK